jgi:aspartokinase-like uncharacterized kinase
MRIIKLGGSLLTTGYLAACLQHIESLPGQILIVPGGGILADQVRQLQSQFGFNDVYAHRMAILAMQQMALLFKGLKPAFSEFSSIYTACDWSGVAIWSANVTELDQAGIENSWDITSDSLAAWLALQLKADSLTLVKAAIIDSRASLTDLHQQNIIDTAFLQFAKQLSCPITIINQDRFLIPLC